MTTNTHVEHPTFIRSFERGAGQRKGNWWTAVAIAGLAIALLAMVVQPSYPETAQGASQETSIFAE